MSLYASPGGNAINVCGVCAHTVHVDVYVVCMLLYRWQNNHVTNSLFQTARVLVAVLDEVVEAFDGDMDNADFGEM